MTDSQNHTAAVDTPSARADSRRSWRQRTVGYALRTIVAVIGVYGAFLLVGLIPVNSGFQQAAGGIEVFVYEGSVHTDLIFPIANAVWDWDAMIPPDAFAEPAPWATHLAIGWGDRGFYLETPAWKDLRFSTACCAMFWPSDTVMHVSAAVRPVEGGGLSRVVMDETQYERLCEEVAGSFARHGDAVLPIDFRYGEYDAFYEARGAYHCFYTCNSWAGDCLKSSGVATPLFTPLPGMAGLYLP